MQEENINENEEVIDPQDVETDSSTEQPEEATSQEAVEKEPPFHEHPRWKEMMEERKQLAEQNNQLQVQLMQILSNSKDSKEQIEDKLYEANTPEEREFWQTVEKVSAKKLEAFEKKLRNDFDAEKRAIYDQYGKIMANQFLKDNPEIKKGSPELEKIVKIARDKGLDLEDAKRIVMFDVNAQMAVEAANKKRQQKTQEKMKANVETKSIPQSSPIVNKGEDVEAVFDEAAKELGISF